ncbi:MAG: SulP family inorganic anion transporter [Candidatus Promineifilaceae bacterium]|nr:SulP family inorganic anion transporter [Candidatus Promineifilaceae bacterium]
MTAVLDKVNLRPAVQPLARYFTRPVRLIKEYDRSFLRPDLIAGLTVAVIMLPQAIAFALIAELPPVMGLYAAIVGGIIGALWGSSNQVHNGPTNANSLLVSSALLSAAFEPGTAEFMVAAGLMAVMAGVFQLVLGLARLGVLVNFVSYSVVVGFSAGAGVLIAIKQLGPLVAVDVGSGSLPDTMIGLVTALPDAHPPTAAIGAGTILLLAILPRISRKLPPALFSMIVASLAVWLFGLQEQGVDVIGQLPSSLPPLADLPLFNLDFINRLSTGALAVGAIGLVQTIAMARSIATQTGQRLDSNQEFVGQGLANIVTGFFSGFPTAGSFSRSAVNLQAGARTPLAAIFSSFFVLIAMFILAPLARFLPTAALAGVLVVIGLGLVDVAEIKRILQGTRGDAIIMAITFAGTLFLPIEFAVLFGILLSFVHYTLRTSMPRVHQVLPDENFHHFLHQPDKESCTQLAVVDILGDLYFGAVNHVEEEIHKIRLRNPAQRYLLIRLNHVNHCDFSGIHMLENVVRMYRDAGGDVFLVRVGDRVRRLMQSTGFDRYLGEDHFLADDEAISYIFHHVLDPAICIYECPVRAFKECQNLPKQTEIDDVPPLDEVPEDAIIEIPPRKLWQQLHDGAAEPPPVVVDVREPREYAQGHIPQAQLVPLRSVLDDTIRLPNDRQIVLVCRSGRRSKRAAYALQKMGVVNVAVLRGGMLDWKSADLLEAIDQIEEEPEQATPLPRERERRR